MSLIEGSNKGTSDEPTGRRYIKVLSKGEPGCWADKRMGLVSFDGGSRMRGASKGEGRSSTRGGVKRNSRYHAGGTLDCGTA